MLKNFKQVVNTNLVNFILSCKVKQPVFINNLLNMNSGYQQPIL